MSEQPVQLRLGFQAPTRPQRMELVLSGMSVVASPEDLDHETAAAYLSSAGVQPRMEGGRGLVFAVRDLPLLLDLPHRVDLVVRGDLRMLWELVQNQPDAGIPVMVTLDGPEDLNLSWPAAGREFNEPLPLRMAPALASLPLPLLASDDTWAALSRAVQLPLVLGRARVNVDGFVELISMSPGRMEMAPIPALFKIDGTHFGVPARYARDVAEVPGVTWEGPFPTPDEPLPARDGLAEVLSVHALEDLDALTTELAGTRGRVVAWSSGLGRRVFCAAALLRMEAFPLLIVTRPAHAWLWKRTWELLGVDACVSPSGTADVRILTYQQAVQVADLPSPAGVIFDDLDIAVQHSPALVRELHRLDGVADMYRIACCRALPEDPEAQVAMLSLVRPVEFKAGIPPVVRYPGDAQRRLREHVACYTSVRSEPPSGVGTWASSRVVVAERSDDLDHRDMPAQPTGALMARRELASSGTESRMGPKVAVALQEARTARANGQSLAVLTLFDSTGSLLRAMLPASSEIPVSVLVGEANWHEARGHARVLLIDYPDRMARLTATVGRPGDPEAPHVTVAHLEGSVDDWLCLAALLVDEGALAPQDVESFVTAGESAPLTGSGGIRSRGW